MNQSNERNNFGGNAEESGNNQAGSNANQGTSDFGEVAGTFALLKVSDTVFELSKMAVDEKFQGKNIGNAMMAFCLEEAKRMHLEKVTLHSNTILGPALHLYKKYGFIEVPDFVSEFKRSNIKMEIVIK